MVDFMSRTLPALRLGEARIGALTVGRQRFGRDRNQQVVPGTDRVTAQIVRCAHGRDRRVVFLCDLGNRFAVADFVTFPAHAFAMRNACKRCGEIVGGLDRHYKPMRAVRIGRPAVVARVIGVHGVDVDASEFGSQREVELRFDVGNHKLRFIDNTR